VASARRRSVFSLAQAVGRAGGEPAAGAGAAADKNSHSNPWKDQQIRQQMQAMIQMEMAPPPPPPPRRPSQQPPPPPPPPPPPRTGGRTGTPVAV
jgi:hypothetical protein